ncbi:unnamed protein product [Cylicocyclus nassatus]|uniref:Phosphoglycolate phosphatase n=1 Tax=Cylicocyclus nassatus TaxID=53992 RepID=A0AA36GBW1_CYLNA|nr:unnamed protein product [Cylicocyclus nassatus]
MNRSSAGGGTFDGVYQAFHDECNRYAKQKKIKISRKTPKLYSMSASETFAKEMTSDGFENLLDEIDVFIFGADGLCWLRDGVITDAANLVNFLIEEKKEVFVLTNDSTNSQESHEKKLRQHRFNAKLDKKHIVTPGLLVADYIKANTSNSKQAYLIASGGIKDDLKENGLNVFGYGPDVLPLLDDNDEDICRLELVAKPDDVGAVIVARDIDFSYKKLLKAANFLRNSRCLFLATNDNGFTNDKNGNLIIPDAGAIAASVQKASMREPVFIGKPHANGLKYIKKLRDTDETKVMMICSSIKCDVMFARRNGLRSLLILNGNGEREELEKMRENQRQDYLPDYYATSLSALLPLNK